MLVLKHSSVELPCVSQDFVVANACHMGAEFFKQLKNWNDRHLILIIPYIWNKRKIIRKIIEIKTLGKK